MTQELVVYSILLLASAYVVVNIVKKFRAKDASDCGGSSGCCGCEIKEKCGS